MSASAAFANDLLTALLVDGDDGATYIALHTADTGAAGTAGAAGPQGPMGPAGPAGVPGDSQLSQRYGFNTGNADAGSGGPCTIGAILLTASTQVGEGMPANGQILALRQYTALFAQSKNTFPGIASEPSVIEVSADGGPANFVFNQSVSGANMNWTQQRYDFTASDNSTLLRFASVNPGGASGPAHLAHLGGMLGAYALMVVWRRGRR